MTVFAIIAPAAIRTVPSLFTDSGAFAQSILIVLFFMSVISWAIMLNRFRLFMRIRAKGIAVRRALQAKGVADAMDSVEQFLPSVEGAILIETKRYLTARGAAGGDWRVVADDASVEDNERKKLRDALERRALSEVSELERHLIFLSTTASVAPFLGLLGTVWGIMSSFLSMGAEGAASLDVVGPGIAEALVTTIAGLATAIPALVGYNLLVRSVHRQEASMDMFISRVIEHAIVARDTRPARSTGDRRETHGASVS